MTKYWCVAAVLCFFVIGRGAAYSQERPEPMSPEISARVLAAVVRIELRKDLTDALGVCVSEDGYVVFRSTSDLRVRTPLPGDKLIVRFSTGDKGNARVIGSSNEWRITLAKIDSEETWPAIPLQQTSVAPGDPCYAVDRKLESDEIAIVPGLVTRVSKRWTASDIQVEGFPADFNTSGELLGITTNKKVGKDCVQTRSDTIHAIWSELKAGGNVDQIRARQIIATEVESRSPRTVALETAVRICTIDEPEGRWSGVVLEDGIVASCGHHQRLPGTKVSFHFANGKIAHGVLMGFNPITDIGLARMSGSGVFDENGQLIDVHVGKNFGQPSRQVRAEFFRLQWSDLLEGKVETVKTRPNKQTRDNQ